MITLIDLLAIINQEIEKANIPYEVAEWKSSVKYPYFVGSYDESNFSFEDSRTEGAFIIDGWSRASLSELIKISEKIKKIFEDFVCTRNGKTYWIRYNNSMPVPTGEEGLNKITVTLYVTEWKGE